MQSVNSIQWFSGWEGGDEWLRSQFRLYLLGLMAVLQQNGKYIFPSGNDSLCNGKFL